MSDETLLGGDGGVDDGGADGGQAEDLSTLFTPDEVTAKKESLAAAKAEEERRAALTDDERKAEDEAKAKADADNKVPEEYAEFTYPEGMTPNKEQLDTFLPLFKQMNLTQTQAQELVTQYAEMRMGEMKSQQDAWEQTKADWRKQSESDPEIGGTKLKEVLVDAGRVMDKYATTDVRELLNTYGIGNHPAVIKMFGKIGRDMAEDTFVTGHGESGKKVTASDFYGNSKMND